MLSIIRGDDKTVTVTFTDSNGSVINITGYTVFFTVKRKENLNDSDDTNALISKTVISHSSPTQGQTQIVFDSEDTSSIDPGIYYYDLQVKKPSGDIESSSSDEFEIIADVTRRVTVST